MAEPARRHLSNRTEWLFTTPSFLWLVVLFLVPTLLVFTIAVKPSSPYGGTAPGWSLAAVEALANPGYPPVIWRTVRISFLTTAICLALAVPAGYCMARATARTRNLLLLAVIVPFWTSFLVRVFAWKSLLHPEGLLKRVLEAVGLAGPETSLLYNEGAVLLVLVYTWLPFAILPIYAAAEKFDFGLLDAARDLGCRQHQAFTRVFLPGISRGLLTAALMVFIPALGSYVIPDIVGGPSGEMFGNLIARRVFNDRNLPHASALAAVLTLFVALPMSAALIMRRRTAPAGKGHR